MTQPKIHNILGVDIKCLTWSLSCNDHLGSYATIEEYYNKDELEGLDTSETADIYRLQIYEHTPVGFTLFTSNSLPNLIKELLEEYLFKG